MPEQAPPGRYTDRPATAEYIGVSPRTLEKWTQQGEVPFVRISRRCVRYDLRAIDAWMAERSVPAAGSGQ